MLACVSFAVHGELHAFGYTGRYLDRYYFFAIDDTFARTLFTFILDDFTFAAAGRAGGTCLHGAQNGLLVANDGAGTFTGRTGFASSIAFGTGAVAVGTGDVLFQFEFLFYTSRYFFQVELHLDAEVGTTETTLLGATSSAKTTETAKASSVSAEDVAEHGEDIVHGHATTESAEGASVACRTAHACKAELVVAGAFVGIAQHVIGFRCFLEFLFRFLVARVLVGVILDGFLAVGFLYLVGRCVLVYSQYLVVISFFHNSTCLLILRLPLWHDGLPCRLMYIQAGHSPGFCLSVLLPERG